MMRTVKVFNSSNLQSSLGVISALIMIKYNGNIHINICFPGMMQIFVTRVTRILLRIMRSFLNAIRYCSRGIFRCFDEKVIAEIKK